MLTSIAAALNWSGNSMIRGGGGRSHTAPIVCSTLGRGHQHVAQSCRNIQTSFTRCLGIQKVCLCFQRIHRNNVKKYFFYSKNSEKNKIMICGIHYFITKIENENWGAASIAQTLVFATQYLLGWCLKYRYLLTEKITNHSLFDT